MGKNISTRVAASYSQCKGSKISGGLREGEAMQLASKLQDTVLHYQLDLSNKLVRK